MCDIVFGAPGKIEKFPKGKIGSGKQPYSCQPMFLPKAIICNHDAKTTDMQKLLQYEKSNVAWQDTLNVAV